MDRIFKQIICIQIALDALLTPIFVRLAYLDRGYFSFGGEYLVTPLIIGAVAAIVILKTNSKGER
jgi:hypothetical protein